MVKELIPDKLLSVIGEENALEQLPSSVPAVYDGAFTSNDERALLL